MIMALCCPICSGVCILQILQDGEGIELECWACHSTSRLYEALKTFATLSCKKPGDGTSENRAGKEHAC